MSAVLVVVQLGHQQEEKPFIQHKVKPLIPDKVKAARRGHRMRENSGYSLTSIIPLFLYSEGFPYLIC